MRIVLTAIAILAAMAAAHSASFDCAQAKTSVEKAICTSPKVSKLDEELDLLYKQAITRTPDAGGARDELRNAQRVWLRETRNSCSDATCLESAYVRRIAALKDQKALHEAAKADAAQEDANPAPQTSATRATVPQKTQTTAPPLTASTAAASPKPAPTVAPTASAKPAESLLVINADRFCDFSTHLVRQRIEAWMAAGIEASVNSGGSLKVNEQRMRQSTAQLDLAVREEAKRFQNSDRLEAAYRATYQIPDKKPFDYVSAVRLQGVGALSQFRDSCMKTSGQFGIK